MRFLLKKTKTKQVLKKSSFFFEIQIIKSNPDIYKKKDILNTLSILIK